MGVENDEIHVNKYFMKDNIPNMIDFLDKQANERKTDDTLEQKITEVAEDTNI